MEESDVELKSSIGAGFLEQTPITVKMTLTAAEWRAFIVHNEKSGGQIARKIGEKVKPLLGRVDSAKRALQGQPTDAGGES